MLVRYGGFEYMLSSVFNKMCTKKGLYDQVIEMITTANVSKSLNVGKN